jgi:hypothetical protein
VTKRGSTMPSARRAAILTAAVIAGLAVPNAALAKLPKPKTTTIVPGVSIAGVKLDMTRAQVFSKWGSTTCPAPTSCTWQGPGQAGHNERASVSFVNGKVSLIAISAATTGTNLKFKAGVLSKWKTAKGIALGKSKSAVKRAYPAAMPNTGEAVQGFDLFKGARPNLSYTRFSTPGIGASPTLLRGIDVAWDTCHFTTC